MIPSQQITTAILIGGQGLRMGGCDKSQLTIVRNGKTQTYLEHLVEELTLLQMPIVLSGRVSQLNESGLPLVEDVRPNCGPLGGLYSILKNCSTDWVFLLACDLPNFDASILEELVSQITPTTSIVVPTTPARNHPTAALYHKRLCPILESLLNKGDYSFQFLFAGLDKEELYHWKIPKQWEHCFHNVNRPQDLEPA